MPLTHPPTQPFPPRDIGRRLRDSFPEILGAPRTRVKFRERVDEGTHVRLLRGRGVARVVGCGGVQECPGGAAEGFDVGWAVVWSRLGLVFHVWLAFRGGGHRSGAERGSNGR